MARHLGTDHHEETVRPDAIAILPDLVWHYDEPFGDSSMIPTWYVCRMARRHVTVALSGDGETSSSRGTPAIRRALEDRRLDWIPEALRRRVLAPIAEALPVGAPARNRLYAAAHHSALTAGFDLGLYPYIKSALRPRDGGGDPRRIRLGFRSLRQRRPPPGRLEPRRPGAARSGQPAPVDRHHGLSPRRHPDQGGPGEHGHSLEARAPLLAYPPRRVHGSRPVDAQAEERSLEVSLPARARRTAARVGLHEAETGFAVPKESGSGRTSEGSPERLLVTVGEIIRGGRGFGGWNGRVRGRGTCGERGGAGKQGGNWGLFQAGGGGARGGGALGRGRRPPGKGARRRRPPRGGGGGGGAGLSIIEVETGHQPIFNEDGRLAIVFNGEIYNYRELRRELESARPPLPDRDRHRGDPPLYGEWGADSVERLRGMFAFAIWDEGAGAPRPRARPARHQAALLRHGPADAPFRIGDQGPAPGRELSARRSTRCARRIPAYLYVPAPRSIFRESEAAPRAHAGDRARHRGA